jgi:hypothetical protein
MPRSAVPLMVLLMAFPAIAQSTRNNDDSCDIGTAPAATLLVPYFEVDIASPVATARTVLISVTNVTAIPQIARLTFWTDWAYPVISLNLFLTGYDMQSINLYDVFAGGVLAPTSNGATPGELSSANSANPGFLPSAATNCSRGSMPTTLPPAVLRDLQDAFTLGDYPFCGTRVGGTHPDVIGYATIDVVADCTVTLPTDEAYYEKELLFDNVLIGDYEVVDPAGNFATGEPMVHIRAIPEGGAAGAEIAASLPLTFYDRFSGGRDRRQPLPSMFAARYIQGGATGFRTNFKIWREGITGAAAACSDYQQNARLETVEYIRFDERANPTTIYPQVLLGEFIHPQLVLPAAALAPSTRTFFPPLTTGDVAGWMYLNLDNAGHYKLTPRARPAQNWVTVSMSAEGRYATEQAAMPLGNGCSPATREKDPIGPRP